MTTLEIVLIIILAINHLLLLPIIITTIIDLDDNNFYKILSLLLMIVIPQIFLIAMLFGLINDIKQRKKDKDRDELLEEINKL